MWTFLMTTAITLAAGGSASVIYDVVVEKPKVKTDKVIFNKQQDIKKLMTIYKG